MGITVELKGHAKSRAEMAKGCALLAEGSLERYAVRNGFMPSRLRNLFDGRIVARPEDPEVIRINADTGADMKAWEK